MRTTIAGQVSLYWVGAEAGTRTPYTLAGILGLVLHHLLGAHVIGQRYGSDPVPGAGTLGQERLAQARHFVLRDVPEAGPRDGLHRREDPAHQIGSAGPPDRVRPSRRPRRRRR